MKNNFNVINVTDIFNDSLNSDLINLNIRHFGSKHLCIINMYYTQDKFAKFLQFLKG